MKKVLSLMLALATLASCSQQPKAAEEKPVESATPTMSRTDSIEAKLIGTWQESTGSVVYRIHKGHKIELFNHEGRRSEENWKLDGDTLKLWQDKDEEPAKLEILKINDEDMTLFSEFFGFPIKFTKLSE